ncbi:MAG: hypothetical protein HY268_06605 [Deltaproteobacteria bacterium]|nr:hypothetical protein [Deltaproteobacteria bacterium]
MKRIKKLLATGMTLGAFTLGATNAGALENLVKTVTEGCKTELETYCKNVTPGEGRVLACLYAYEDKLSGRCDYALYDASVQLERVVNAISYVANECEADLKKYCADLSPGGGRLAACLKKNEQKLDERCQQAMKDIKLEAK